MNLRGAQLDCSHTVTCVSTTWHVLNLSGHNICYRTEWFSFPVAHIQTTFSVSAAHALRSRSNAPLLFFVSWSELNWTIRGSYIVLLHMIYYDLFIYNQYIYIYSGMNLKGFCRFLQILKDSYRLTSSCPSFRTGAWPRAPAGEDPTMQP